MKIFTLSFFLGIGLGFWMNIFLDNSINHDLFFEVKKSNYDIQNENLKEKYQEWEIDFGKELEELRQEVIKKVKIYKIKEKEGALDSDIDKFPCEEYTKHAIDYYNFHALDIEQEIVDDLDKYCNTE